MSSFASTFSAKVEHISTSTTELDDVQLVTITQGRKDLSDLYRSAVIVIEGRNPSALPSISIGDKIIVTIEAFDNGTPVTLPSWEKTRSGRVSNIEIDYGIVPALDKWRITTEDAFAVLGRAAIDLTVTAGTVTANAAKQITDALGITMVIQSGSIPSPSTVKTTTFESANALDAFQGYANTEFAFVVQQGEDLEWIPRQGWTNTGSNITFTDDLIENPTGLTFQSLQVSNLADAVAQEVLVSIRGGNTVSTGPGDTYLQLNTYDSSNGQALNLGQFVKALFTNSEPVPFSLSYMLTGQDPEKVLRPVATELRQININFRGNVSRAIVMGFTISITPEVSRATLNLLDIQQIPIFQLDSTDTGVLDQNVLGY